MGMAPEWSRWLCDRSMASTSFGGMCLGKPGSWFSIAP